VSYQSRCHVLAISRCVVEVARAFNSRADSVTDVIARILQRKKGVAVPLRWRHCVLLVYRPLIAAAAGSCRWLWKQSTRGADFLLRIRGRAAARRSPAHRQHRHRQR
jgi:hypothetical protein